MGCVLVLQYAAKLSLAAALLSRSHLHTRLFPKEYCLVSIKWEQGFAMRQWDRAGLSVRFTVVVFLLT